MWTSERSAPAAQRRSVSSYQTNVWVYRYTEMDDLTFSHQLPEFITRLEDALTRSATSSHGLG